MKNKESQDKIIEDIISIIEVIPGIVGFEPIVSNETNSSTNDKNEIIKIITNENHVEISIGILISRNVTVKNIEKELSETVAFYFKNKHSNKYKFQKLNLYIKGVK